MDYWELENCPTSTGSLNMMNLSKDCPDLWHMMEWSRDWSMKQKAFGYAVL